MSSSGESPRERPATHAVGRDSVPNGRHRSPPEAVHAAQQRPVDVPVTSYPSSSLGSRRHRTPPGRRRSGSLTDRAPTGTGGPTSPEGRIGYFFIR